MDKEFGDDFEFKPLTEGLGFHKKTIDLREDRNPIDSIKDFPLKTNILPKSRAPVSNIKNQEHSKAQSIHPGTEFKESRAWSPALHDKTIVDPIKKQKVETVSQAGSLKYNDLSVSWPAALFDGAMILGLGLLFSAVVFALTKIDLGDLISMLRDETGAQAASLLLVLAVFEIYCVTCRSFFGKTLGEWAFDCRLGLPADQSKTVYPLQVAWRTLVIALTGFIVLPVLSSIMNQDIAGSISGVSLKQEVR